MVVFGDSSNYSMQAHHGMNSNTQGKLLDSWYVSSVVHFVRLEFFLSYITFTLVV